ncbi:MAG: lipid-A-disaccharide synthase [Opitutales bacterium]
MLNVPAGDSFDLLIVAGEASGDEHAARLLGDLRAKKPGLQVAALGGPKLEKAGADLLLDLTEHAVVGVFEVLKNLGFFKALFGETLAWIEKTRPQTVMFVDYPGFNLRLAEALRRRGVSRKGGGEVRLLQYVSPQLWAWKPKRRFKMARTLDALGVIFPFETETYADVDLPVRFVGHPFAREDYEATLSHDPEAPVLLLPGSRRQPVVRILPVLLDAFLLVAGEASRLRARIVSPSGEVRTMVEGLIARRPKVAGKVKVVGNDEHVSASAVLTSSGTMSLACAMAGLPGAIAYRAHPLTYLLGKFLVKVPHLGMANLLLPDKPVYPEFIQGDAKPAKLAQRLRRCLDDPEEAAKAKEAAECLRKLLARPAEVSVADWAIQEGGLGEATN